MVSIQCLHRDEHLEDQPTSWTGPRPVVGRASKFPLDEAEGEFTYKCIYDFDSMHFKCDNVPYLPACLHGELGPKECPEVGRQRSLVAVPGWSPVW